MQVCLDQRAAVRVRRDPCALVRRNMELLSGEPVHRGVQKIQPIGHLRTTGNEKPWRPSRGLGEFSVCFSALAGLAADARGLVCTSQGVHESRETDDRDPGIGGAPSCLRAEDGDRARQRTATAAALLPLRSGATVASALVEHVARPLPSRSWRCRTGAEATARPAPRRGDPQLARCEPILRQGLSPARGPTPLRRHSNIRAPSHAAAPRAWRERTGRPPDRDEVRANHALRCLHLHICGTLGFRPIRWTTSVV